MLSLWRRWQSVPFLRRGSYSILALLSYIEPLTLAVSRERIACEPPSFTGTFRFRKAFLIFRCVDLPGINPDWSIWINLSIIPFNGVARILASNLTSAHGNKIGLCITIIVASVLEGYYSFYYRPKVLVAKFTHIVCIFLLTIHPALALHGYQRQRQKLLYCNRNLQLVSVLLRERWNCKSLEKKM